MDSVILFMFIILFATTLQASTGFGFSIMATPLLLLLFEPREAIQVNLLLSLVISSALIMKIRHDVHIGILKRLIIGSLVGLPIGIVVLLMINMTTLKIGISILILLLTVMLLFNVRTTQTNKKDFVVGSLSGALTTSIGMPGPPLLLYFSGTDTTKEQLRGTTLAFYLFIYLVSYIIQVIFVGTSIEVWTASFTALPVVLVGLFLGQIMFKRINQQNFRFVTYVLLICTGSYLLFQQF